MTSIEKRGRRIFTVLLFALALATVFSAGSFASITNRVQIIQDGVVADVETKAKTVGELLKEEHIGLTDTTIMNATYETLIKDGLKLRIDNKKRVYLTVAGKERIIDTYQNTTEHILKEAKISVDDWKHVHPGKTDRIQNNDRICVDLYETIQEINEKKTPFKKETKPDNSLLKGEKKQVQTGKDQIERRIYAVQLKNGKKIAAKLIKTDLVQKGQPEITLVGTKTPTIANAGSYSRVINVTATAYDASYESNGSWGAVTAMGTSLRHGVIAVDPSVIPLGSRVYVECDGWSDYGVAVAEDTGSAIQGHRIDLFFSDPSVVDAFGVRSAKVYILN